MTLNEELEELDRKLMVWWPDALQMMAEEFETKYGRKLSVFLGEKFTESGVYLTEFGPDSDDKFTESEKTWIMNRMEAGKQACIIIAAQMESTEQGFILKLKNF